MANEIYQLGFPSGYTLYALIRNSTGQIWYPTAEDFEDFGTGSRSHSDYDIPLTDKSGGMYVADFPSAIPANTSTGYRTVIYRQEVGASPASTDHIVGGATIKWTGSAELAEEVEENATSIVNRAFFKLGGGRTSIIISDIEDDTDDNAVNANTIYAQVRNEVLIELAPNECKEFADLGTEAEVSEMADWDYAFSLPADCIAVVAQIDEDDHTTKYEYEIRRAYLFTNDYTNSDGDSAYIDYIKKVTDASEYKPKTIEAIASKLAAELAPLYDPDRIQELKQEYELLVKPLAQALNQKEQYFDDEGSYSWRDARTS